MRFVQIFFLLPVIAFSLQAQAQANLPPIIDRELFFGPPEIAGGQLSPDGKYILYVQDKGGDENFNIYAVNPAEKPAPGQDIPNNRILTDYKGVRTIIYSVPKSDPDALYIGLNDRDKAWHDLYKLKVSTGEKTLLRQNSDKDRITGWIFDWNDKLRLATRSNEDGSNDLLRVDEKELVPIYSTGPFEEFDPYSFDKENKQIYIATNKGNRNLKQLVLLDPNTMKEQFVEKDPLNRVDFGGANFSEITKTIIYTSYIDEKKEIIGRTNNL